MINALSRQDPELRRLDLSQQYIDHMDIKNWIIKSENLTFDRQRDRKYEYLKYGKGEPRRDETISDKEYVERMLQESYEEIWGGKQ